VRARGFFDDVMHRLRTVPGVASVAVTTIPPFSSGSSSGSFDVEGRAASGTAPKLAAQRRSTSPDFFTVVGVPIVAGRAYTDADRAAAPLVVVVNETLARREWPNESAVGKRIRYSGAWRTVIGVAGDIATERASAEPPELIYSPLAQIMMRGLPTLIVRTRNDGDVDAATIRRAMQDVDRSVTVSHVDAMPDLITAALADDRLRTVLIAMFAAIAALLAAIGTYGVAAASASRRVREMAIRMAVGASQASVARLVIGGAAKGVAIGAVVGVGLAWMGTRLLAPYLFGVGAMDPIVYAAVAILLAATTFGATYVPARRAKCVRLVDTLTGE
jgi:putative ABC transport system permease protein